MRLALCCALALLAACDEPTAPPACPSPAVCAPSPAPSDPPLPKRPR
jgi:hypothetical protein